jgi:hypothetical protein
MQLHNDLKNEVVALSGKDKAIAVCMDSPKVNRKACELLKEMLPNLIAFGCQVHGLNLLVKVGKG